MLKPLPGTYHIYSVLPWLPQGQSQVFLFLTSTSSSHNEVASVKNPVPMQSSDELYIFTAMTIPDCLTYRQGIVRHGKWNITGELPWSVPINERKMITN